MSPKTVSFSSSFSPTVGVVAVGVGVSILAYLLLSRRQSGSLTLYAGSGSNVGTFREVAEASGAQRILPVTSKTAVQAALTNARGLGRLILVGHGTPTNFFNGVMNLDPQLLASWMAGSLSSGAVVGFAGCRAAADPGEADWGPNSYGPGGAQSYIGRLRDRLYQLGVPRNVELRGHSTTGHAGGNPAGRVFRVGEYGQQGRSVIDLIYGTGAWQREDTRTAWVRAFEGTAAQRWINGASLQEVV